MAKKSRRHRNRTAKASAPATAPAPVASAPPPPAHHPVTASDVPDTATATAVTGSASTPCSHGFAPFASATEHRAYVDASRSLFHAIVVEVEGDMARLKKEDDRVVSILNYLHSRPQLDPQRIIETLLLNLDSMCKTQQDKDRAFASCRLHGTLLVHLTKILLVKRGEFTGKDGLSFREEYSKLEDCDKETVKFFDRRITCECLKPLLAVASSKEAPGEPCQGPGCNATAGKVVGRALMLCSCKTIKYCSKECQLQDWARHKAFCRETRTLRETEAQRDLA